MATETQTDHSVESMCYPVWLDRLDGARAWTVVRHPACMQSASALHCRTDEQVGGNSLMQWCCFPCHAYNMIQMRAYLSQSFTGDCAFASKQRHRDECPFGRDPWQKGPLSWYVPVLWSHSASNSKAILRASSKPSVLQANCQVPNSSTHANGHVPY